MPELRRPPVTTPRGTPAWAKALLGLGVLSVLGSGLAAWSSRVGAAPDATSTELDREVAAKLLAAGVLDEAGSLYERVLRDTTTDAATRGHIAFSLGTAWLDEGQYEAALRWFYEAEIAGDPETTTEAAAKIVHCLERLGRIHEAQAVLASRTSLDAPAQRAADDPVVAKVGARSIHASEVNRALDDLPPQLAASFETAEARAQFLQKYVAEELLWRKAQKLEYAKDPEVRRQLEVALRQIVLTAFVEREVVGRIQTTDGDLQTWYQAHKVQYRQPAQVKTEIVKLRGAYETEGATFDGLGSDRGVTEHTFVQGTASFGVKAADALAPLFEATPGSLAAPIETETGAIWVRVGEVTPAGVQPFEEVRGRVERDLKNSKVQEAWQDLIEEQLTASDVALFPEAMEGSP